MLSADLFKRGAQLPAFPLHGTEKPPLLAVRTGPAVAMPAFFRTDSVFSRPEWPRSRTWLFAGRASSMKSNGQG